MTSTTIDTAIAAWKAATTQADRDLAAEAIAQHIAHETPEGSDYESATEELIDRLKAEFGPVPVEDLRDAIAPNRFYIALPAAIPEGEVEGIWGIGRSEELAIEDAHHWTQTRPATVGEGEWVVSHEGTYEAFPTATEAHAYAKTLGYRAEPCTEALYRRVKAEGYDVTGRNSYTYAKNGSVYDVVEREAA
ncbi:hypothetical protein [Methylobacterium frigidaeris]|uniref:Uncharacterized protein n=1 Tax=Methylobacterium frigidaeris TaxID=2038277 RepID=A0AA37M8T0_9HYPH|nr:hypothetical protein [Methylobacterium frigidaeris]GJD66487.1 hypothetical protein MPEAHAMD_6685 [Methylobacterium frigidaeris]